ncbi:MAG: hypothetical protein IAE79_09800 [Anaerolinea sp.]|nr:hypothetical protein [Anaerolinea sp.]
MMSENESKGKLQQIWRKLGGWLRQPRQKQLAEEKIADDHAEMVWADDGGPIIEPSGSEKPKQSHK